MLAELRYYTEIHSSTAVALEVLIESSSKVLATKVFWFCSFHFLNQVLKNFYFLFKNLPCDKASRENKTKWTEKSSPLASVVCNAVQLPGERDLCQHLSYSQYGALVEHQ